jgi:hypothetical protein
MAAFGYSKRVVNEHGLHELSEVTFDVPLNDLRRIAAFLLECADKAESGDWRNSHRHLTEHDRQWDNDHPDSDVIVIHPNPEPPARVQ